MRRIHTHVLLRICSPTSFIINRINAFNLPDFADNLKLEQVNSLYLTDVVNYSITISEIKVILWVTKSGPLQVEYVNSNYTFYSFNNYNQ